MPAGHVAVSSRGGLCLVSPAEHAMSRLPLRSDEDPDEVSFWLLPKHPKPNNMTKTFPLFKS
jgi:hypothetical protein